MIELIRSVRIPELAWEFEPSLQTIRNWIKQAVTASCTHRRMQQHGDGRRQHTRMA